MNPDETIKTLRYIAMLRTFEKHIVNFCGTYSNSLDDAQDLRQDICEELWLRIDGLHDDSTPAQQNRWLHRLMVSVLMHRLRHFRLHTVPLEGTLSVADEDRYAYDELLEDVLAHLSTEDGQLLKERLEGFSHAEIGRRHGLSESAVRQLLHRVILYLKKTYRP